MSQLESFWLNLFHLHFPTVREQCQHSHLHLVRGHQCARLGCVAHNSKSPVFNAKYGVWIWCHYYCYSYSYSYCDYYSYSYHYCCCYYRSCFSAFWYACPGAINMRPVSAPCPVMAIHSLHSCRTSSVLGQRGLGVPQHLAIGLCTGTHSCGFACLLLSLL